MSTPFKMKGWSPFTKKTKTISRKEDQPNKKLEGHETMGGEQLRDDWGENTNPSTDYYIKRTKDGDPMILGEVSLEGGKVTGVPGSKGGKLTRKSN